MLELDLPKELSQSVVVHVRLGGGEKILCKRRVVEPLRILPRLDSHLQLVQLPDELCLLGLPFDVLFPSILVERPEAWRKVSQQPVHGVGLQGYFGWSRALPGHGVSRYGLRKVVQDGES